MLSRRQFGLGLTSMASLGVATKATAQAAQPDGRVAIIDSPTDVSPYVDRLKANGVRVIGRYYARKPQPELGLPHKRLVDNGVGDATEAKVITGKGINILSTYQYYSGGDGAKFFFGRKDTGSPRKEAEADAHAALHQARTVGQPEQSAIYFGVDFDCREGAKGPDGREQIAYILDYFDIIKDIVGPHYRIGAYANGYVNKILRHDKISLSWISPSASFAQTPDFIRNGDWHLYQNQVDRFWFADKAYPTGLDLDTNIQRQVADIGFWGGDPVPDDRVTAIYSERRPAIRRTSVYRAPVAKDLIVKSQCVQKTVEENGRKKTIWVTVDENSVSRLKNVRVLEEKDGWLHVDIDDDGMVDGYCIASDFAASLKEIGDW